MITSADGQRVLAIGYNGNWMGGPNACDSSEPGLCGCLHSEENALIKLDYNDSSRKILYTTTAPCVMCAKRIINAKITAVRYLNAYRKTEGVELLQKAGIEVWKLDEGNVPLLEDRKDGTV